MTAYRVELQAVTTKVVVVEASNAVAAEALAHEWAYDDVDEVDRSAWRTVHVVEGVSA